MVLDNIKKKLRRKEHIEGKSKHSLDCTDVFQLCSIV